jgi:hypothetical protein
LPFKGTEQWDYILENGYSLVREIHKFHPVSPRIVFETPEFDFNERLESIKPAKQEGYYSESNDRSYFFDMDKEIAQKIQAYLPTYIANRLYFFMKNYYRKRLLNKELHLLLSIRNIGQEVLNLNDIRFNIRFGNLMGWCFETPCASYLPTEMAMPLLKKPD